MKLKSIWIGAGLLVLVLLAFSSTYIVYQSQQALILQFGQPVGRMEQAGLHFKLPWRTIIHYDKRVLDLDPPAEQLILSDQKRLDVDAFARWRIVDPLRFYQSVGSELVLEQRLNTVLISALRRVLGNVTLLSVLSQQRDRVMSDIKQQVNTEMQRFGIEIVDVRIRRADLPEETSQAIYARMRSEREREAAQFRAQGAEQAQQVRARADRERTVLLADAQRQGQILRGQGDNQALRLIAEAAGHDSQFYAFYRSLRAYKEALQPDDTTMVLSPSSDFFKYFGRLDSAIAGAAAAPAAGKAGTGAASDLPPVTNPAQAPLPTLGGAAEAGPAKPGSQP